MKQALTLLAIIVGIVCGNFPQVFGGETIGKIANEQQTAFVPAGYAFAIWGLIFAGQLAFGIYQALPAQRDKFAGVRLLAAFNSIFAGAWAVAYSHRLFVLPWFLMLATLASLIVLAIKLGSPADRKDYWFVYIPYHLNVGWISVATMANTSQFLRYQVGWEGAPLTPNAWAGILIVIAAALGLVMLVKKRDYAFASVIAWALIAIGVK